MMPSEGAWERDMEMCASTDLVAEEERVSLARGDGSDPLVAQGSHEAGNALLTGEAGEGEC